MVDLAKPVGNPGPETGTTSGGKNQKKTQRRWEDGGKVMKIWKGQDGRGGLEAEVPESKPAGFPRLQSTNIRDGIDEYPMGARAVLVLPEL